MNANGAALTPEQVLAASRKKRASRVRAVQLPDIGAVYLVPPSPADRLRLLVSQQQAEGDADKASTLSAEFIAACWADSNGYRVDVSPDVIRAIADGMLQEDIDRLWEAATELAADGLEQIEEAAKN